jgi:hypothetical protein
VYLFRFGLCTRLLPRRKVLLRIAAREGAAIPARLAICAVANRITGAGFLSRRGVCLTVMGMFTNLMSKIFGHTTAAPSSSAAPASSAVASPTPTVAAATPTSPTTPAASATPSSPGTPSSPAAAPPQAVDVTAILDDLAAKNPEKLEWRKSIVDLMKLVGVDSSLAARKELAAELHYSGDEKDSATMNIWLHKQVIIKIAENGGKVPKELLS